MGLPNGKDLWCMTFSKVLGVTVIREAQMSKQGLGRIEVTNPFASCPYQGRQFANTKGTCCLGHFDKCHECKQIPSMGIWDLIVKLIWKNPDARVMDLLGFFLGYACPLSGFVEVKASSVNDHIRSKHIGRNVEAEQCQVLPQVRLGEGESDDSPFEQKTAEKVEKIKRTWTKEQAEIECRQWKRELMQEWEKRVQEKHILRSEAKCIRSFEVTQGTSSKEFHLKSPKGSTRDR
jgi:hypothetical protein